MLVTRSADGLPILVARYAERFHAEVTGHHVASPLGAWLLLALAGKGCRGELRARLSEVLGIDADIAAELAAALLTNPHPIVASGAAAWWRPGAETQPLLDWLRFLPERVETGDVPSQAEADAWARRHTFDLIKKFPLAMSPDTVLVLATALATKVSWETPFAVAPVDELGSKSPWRSRVSRVLRSPNRGFHDSFIAMTDRAGDVAVHTARARHGLAVTCVAGGPDASAGDVLATAHDIAIAEAEGSFRGRRSLFDLPLGDGPAWTLTERPARTTVVDGREERYKAFLPAWSAKSDHDLSCPDSLGFSHAAEALIAMLQPNPAYWFEAKQSSMARYSRVGFEAAAVTAIAILASGEFSPGRTGLLREATLRFGHPFAAVAVAVDNQPDTETGKTSPWHALPVFSAWIEEPDEVDDPVGP